MNCKTCQSALGPRNKTGYCRAHVSAAQAACPEFRAKQRAGIKRKLATDPAYLDDLRRRARTQGKRLDTRPQRSERFKREQIWKIGQAAAASSESRAKAGRSLSRTRNAWCPPELLDAYRDLTKLGYRAAEARRMILDQHERDKARFAAKIDPSTASYDAAVYEPKTDEEIIRLAAQMLKVNPADIVGPKRDKALVDARAALVMVYRSRKESYPTIGRRLNRDHTAIMHLAATFDIRERRNPKLRAVVERLAA